jgi:DNA mismatch repair protein MutS
VAVRREDQKKSGSSEVEEALKGINPDDLSPREALDALYALKKTLGGG